jgi:hypothetical protein
MGSITHQDTYFINILNENDLFIESANEMFEHQEPTPQVEVKPIVKKHNGVATSTLI